MSVRDNLKQISENIGGAAQSASRSYDDVELVAVSKKQPDNRIDEALEAGQRVFGENRVQEAEERWSSRRVQYPGLKLHLIGPLQTNKVKNAVALFDVIETVDREKLAKKLAQEMQKQDRGVPCFIQVNTGNESQKAGISITEFPDFLDFCLNQCELDVSGLMCIPPFGEPPAPHFALLHKLAARHDLKYLSMGMSADYEQAIQLGATHIRVGSALFGDRV